MNLLAHALLTPSDAPSGVLVGNLTADWIKGRARHALPTELREGVTLHRRIDGFTDTHALVDGCSELLSEKWGRYAPVLVDIFFDHVLSCEWANYCVIPREAFIAATYTALRENQHLLPPRAHYGASALLADDWFNCYATLDGIALSLSRLSSRLNHNIELAPAVHDFAVLREPFHKAFNEFFPQLRRHVEGAPHSGVH